MEKIKVSKELKECLDYLIELEGREWIIKKHALKTYYTKCGWATEKYKHLNGLNLDFLAKLLYEGYEVEETKEEKLLKRVLEYSKEDHLFDGNSHIRGRKKGILECLEILEIEIKGINC